jgi:cell division protein FtsB
MIWGFPEKSIFIVNLRPDMLTIPERENFILKKGDCMAEQERTTPEQAKEVLEDKEKKTFSGMLIVAVLLVLIFISIGVSGLWIMKLSSRVSSLSSELKTLKGYNQRVVVLEDKQAMMEIQNQVKVIERSISDLSGLANTFKQIDAAKAKDMESVVAGLEEERELLKKQLANYQQAVDKVLAGSPDLPSLQAARESEAAVASGEENREPTWWEKIVGYRFFGDRE